MLVVHHLWFAVTYTWASQWFFSWSRSLHEAWDTTEAPSVPTPGWWNLRGRTPWTMCRCNLSGWNIYGWSFCGWILVLGGRLVVNELQHKLCFIQQVMLRLPVYIWFHDNRDTFPGLTNDNTDGFLKPPTWTNFTWRDEVFDNSQQSLLEGSFANTWWPGK